MNKDKGILLMAFGSSTYGRYAYNMAQSIRYYTGLPIYLLCDNIAISGIDTSVFDFADVIDFKDEDACLRKIKLFKRSPFEKTLYLDVDGVCLSDPSKLIDIIEKDHFVFSQVMGIGGKQDSISYNPWATNETIWKHFNLKEDTVFPTLQTSMIYFDKSKKAQQFFNRLHENYKNKLDKSQYLEMWGKGSHHPDELYYAVTMAQLGIVPTKSIQPVFFPNKQESITTIERDFTILSMYGSGSLVRPYAKDHYDRVMQRIMGKVGMAHHYKAANLYRGKFTGQ